MAYSALGEQYIYGEIDSPDAAVHDPAASDVLIVTVDIAPADWSPLAETTIAAKWNTTGDQRSWVLKLATNGALKLYTSTDGTAGTATSETSASNLSALLAYERQVVQAELDTATGNVIFRSGATVATLAALGATQTGAGATLPFAGTAVLSFGEATSQLFEGKLVIGGVTVANPVASGVKQYEDTYVCPADLAWTEAGSRIRFSKQYPTAAVGVLTPRDAQVVTVAITAPEVVTRVGALDMTPVVGANPGLYPA